MYHINQNSIYRSTDIEGYNGWAISIILGLILVVLSCASWGCRKVTFLSMRTSPRHLKVREIFSTINVVFVLSYVLRRSVHFGYMLQVSVRLYVVSTEKLKTIEQLTTTSRDRSLSLIYISRCEMDFVRERVSDHHTNSLTSPLQVTTITQSPQYFRLIINKYWRLLCTKLYQIEQHISP